MSANSKIEWTDATWNPLLGCDKCSAGCALCYAIRTAWRLQHNPNPTVAAAYEGLVKKRADGSLNWTGRINLLPERLREPMGWRKSRRIFVNSQSDLFHAAVPHDFIHQVFAVMALCPQHVFQVLTKRPERMRDYVTNANTMEIEQQCIALAGESGDEWHLPDWPLPNVWLGTSVENQRAANERIPALLATPAAVRFLSVEPLLGAIDLRRLRDAADELAWRNSLTGEAMCDGMNEPARGERVQWVIAGGESGLGARPMAEAWAKSLRDQCAEAGVAFFFKQWGEWELLTDAFGWDAEYEREFPNAVVQQDGKWTPCRDADFDRLIDTDCHAEIMHRIGKAHAGRLLDGREHNDFPR